MNKKVSTAGFSCFLPLLFVSLFPSSIITPPSIFLTAGPRFGMTKDKIWLVVIFLMFFPWRLFCAFYSFTEVCWLGDETTKVKRLREKRWAFGAENWIKYFDCLVVSTLFFLVSICFYFYLSQSAEQ